jgi:alkylation response protein AidB-like acyl-CoA dehydrogenase
MLRNHLPRFFSSYGLNHYTIDRPLQLTLEYTGLSSSTSERLEAFGDYVGGDLLEVCYEIDQVSHPRLRMWDIDGQRFDWVQISPAHRAALEKLRSLGIVNSVFTEDVPWQLHYAMGYLLADPGLYCTLILTVQTAYALFKYGDDALRERYLSRYLDPDPQTAWYGATFYTETHGGSDLGANRAVARRDGDRWLITTEDKYFASNAGIADGALVTARPEGGVAGPKGIVLYFVPAFREDGSANYTIRRLKEKLGTRAVPTGEVDLQDAEAYLIGELNHGIYTALEVLTLARLANSVAAVGIARKAYLEALQYAKKRTAFGKLLIEHPLVRKDLLEMEVELEANLLLAFKAVQVFNDHWREAPPYSEGYHYARLLAHLAKNMTAEMSAWVTRMAMELHGGIGFLEEFPVARWHREALITPIWEGTSNIQSLDMMEVMAKKGVHEPLFADIEEIASRTEDSPSRAALMQGLDSVRQRVAELFAMKPEAAQFYAKELLTEIGELTAVALLVDAGGHAAEKHGDHRFLRAAQVYAQRHLRGERLSLTLLEKAGRMIQIDSVLSA